MGSGNTEETAVDLAKKILGKVENNWHELSRLSVADLCLHKGIGEAKAISIIAAVEIGSRKSQQLALQKPKITSSRDAYDVFRPKMADLTQEEFYVMHLNQANKVICTENVSSGGINQTLVDVRVVFKSAIEKRSTALIVAHNHPSGEVKPSNMDIQITKKLCEGGKLIDISVLDHLIIAPNEYYSFADEGLIS